MSAPISWDLDWLRANHGKHENVKLLCIAYNNEHGTDYAYDTFKSMCRHKGFSYAGNYFTEEQIDFLKENYSELGKYKCAEEIEKRFGAKHSPACVKRVALRNGLKVTREANKKLRTDARTRLNIGDVVHRKHHSSVIVGRDENGREIAETLGKYIWEQANGPIPKGHNIIYLDGDSKNTELDNMRVIPNGYRVILMRHNKWGGKGKLTEAGIKYCELICAIKEAENELDGRS